MEENKCEDCRWFVRIAGSDKREGKCYLNPPGLYNLPLELGSVSARPVTHESNFCSKWEMTVENVKSMHEQFQEMLNESMAHMAAIAKGAEKKSDTDSN